MLSVTSILPLTVEAAAFSGNGTLLVEPNSFTIPAGGLTVLLGPNGAGKSLTLRLCHGLLTPSRGAVRWAAGANSAERKARAAQALQRFGLAERAAQPARLLSGGEQQRLAIARAWALRPELLFLDEPTSQLDPAATRQIEELLSGLVAEGITVMMSTHDLGQARRLADRVLFLHRGRLVEDALAKDFFAGPASAEARAFLAGELLW